MLYMLAVLLKEYKGSLKGEGAYAGPWPSMLAVHSKAVQRRALAATP